jgi:hypothetical protein
MKTNRISVARLLNDQTLTSLLLQLLPWEENISLYIIILFTLNTSMCTWSWYIYGCRLSAVYLFTNEPRPWHTRKMWWCATIKTRQRICNTCNRNSGGILLGNQNISRSKIKRVFSNPPLFLIACFVGCVGEGFSKIHENMCDETFRSF